MGPYHPALPQPFALTFKLRGERIVAVERPVSGYCRRDIESLIIGRDADDALNVIERACSWSGHTYRMALALALEAASGATVSPRAQLIRAIFAEGERIMARLWLLAQVARAANLQPILRDALEAREGFYDALVETTGERHYWGIAEVGGVRELDTPDLSPLAAALDQFGATVESWRLAAGRRGPLGRSGAQLGQITLQQAREQRLSSVAARATGMRDDLRRDAPYGGYALAALDWPDEETTERNGDVAARCAVAAEDLATSVRVAGALLRALRSASDPPNVGTLSAIGINGGHAKVEAPHGVVEVNASVATDGRVNAIRLDTPATDTFALLPTVLDGQSVSASAVILASLDLCVECLDQ